MAGTEEEIVRIGKKLDSAAGGEDMPESVVLDLLKSLQSYKMNLELLQKTRIGMKVNSMRKVSKNDEIVTLSKTLVKGWKKLLDGKTPSKKSSESTNGATTPMENDEDSNFGQTGDVASQGSANSADSNNDRLSDGRDSGSESKPSSQPPPTSRQSSVSDTADEMRLKCRSMLSDALRTDDANSVIDDEVLQTIAAQVEDAAMQLHRGDTKKYMACLRSRIFNLKDKKNPDLRRNVLLGRISPERLAAMTPEEMASKALNEIREKMTKEAIEEHQLSTDIGTPTNLFTCGKCKSKNCTYTQAQTRSADEPMTTFVLCQKCGNRWKFC